MSNEKTSKLTRIVAEDIMTENVVAIRDDMTIGQVAHLMLRERVSGYPVIDSEKHVIGVVTLTDLFVLIDKIVHQHPSLPSECQIDDFEAALAKSKDMKVSQILSKNLLVISPSTTIHDIIEAVVKSNIYTFPVMKDEKLVGIIGRHDVLNAAFSYA